MGGGLSKFSACQDGDLNSGHEDFQSSCSREYKGYSPIDPIGLILDQKISLVANVLAIVAND